MARRPILARREVAAFRAIALRAVSSTADRRSILAMHITIAIVVPGFLALAWWQVDRALSGNSLSWAYVFEWPVFAGYAIYVWWKVTHEANQEATPEIDPAQHDPAQGGTPGFGTTKRAAIRPDLASAGTVEEDEDSELARYNEYLAALNASDRRKRW